MSLDDRPGDEAEPAHLRDKYDDEICRLYLDEAGRLGRHLIRKGAWPELAADIVQDSFLATRLRWHVVRTYERPPAYLYRVAENRMRRLLGKELTMGEPHPDPRAAAHRSNERAAQPDLELRLVIDEAINNLPPQVGRAARLYYLADRKVSDVARTLKVSENTAKGYLLEARRRLKRDLGGWTEGER